MHPDDMVPKYTMEWPKTKADYLKLMQMEDCKLKKIKCDYKTIDGKSKHQGIKLFFEDDADAIVLGKMGGDTYTSAEFNDTQKITSVEVTEEDTDSYGNVRNIRFYEANGTELAIPQGGADYDRRLNIMQPAANATWPGKTINLPKGHVIIGVAC